MGGAIRKMIIFNHGRSEAGGVRRKRKNIKGDLGKKNSLFSMTKGIDEGKQSRTKMRPNVPSAVNFGKVQTGKESPGGFAIRMRREKGVGVKGRKRRGKKGKWWCVTIGQWVKECESKNKINVLSGV